MAHVDLIFKQDLICFPDGVKRVIYKEGSKVAIEAAKAQKYIEAGYCEAFKERETKPAVIKKEVKATKPKVKREKQSKRTTSD
jgi:hypothetical protein